MSKETETVKPTVRRGISNNTRAVAWLKFHEKDAAQNGLFKRGGGTLRAAARPVHRHAETGFLSRRLRGSGAAGVGRCERHRFSDQCGVFHSFGLQGKEKIVHISAI